MQSKIHEWNEIKEKYTESIILGNGSSIAVNDSFRYESLHAKANELKFITPEVQSLFDNFDTHDFEAILHKLLQAETVNQSLSIKDNAVKSAYQTCRQSLIKVVQNIHPHYHSVEQNSLNNIAEFLKNFKKVISLNYDLILYWAMYRGNQPVSDENGSVVESGNLFKDGFIEKSNGDKCFNSDWHFLEELDGTRKSVTLIFYLHGNLSLASYIKDRLYEFDVKIASPGNSHLGVIFDKWNTGKYSPLFVCEGESKRKLAAIKNSTYLSAVYYDVLSCLGDSIAVYGFDFGGQDEHIIARLREVSQRRCAIRNLAVSVYVDGSHDGYMSRVQQIVTDRIGKNMTVEFFDSKSKSCWNNG